MTNTFHPCLWFDNEAKQAAEFYCSVFDHSKIKDENPIVVNFEIWGNKFMGLNGGPMFKMNPAISMFVLCRTVEETNALWDKLIAGGKALMPIDTYGWSERYGWLQDKFGFTWQIAVVYNAGDEPKMTPSLLFTKGRFGQAEAAINYYTALFPNSGINQLMHYAPNDANAGKVLYSEFKLNGQDTIAMDGPGQHEYEFNEAVSFVIECKDQNEIDFFWNAFLQGGKESKCGWICDKFGVWWQVVPKNLGQYMTNPERAQRVMQALLKMTKLDIETLANA